MQFLKRNAGISRADDKVRKMYGYGNDSKVAATEATIPQGKTVFTSKPPAKIKDSDKEKLLKIRQMLDKEKKPQNEEKDTHVTKDGRTVKKGLWYYMNKRKKAGTSRPKSAGTVSPEAMKKSQK